MTQDHVLQQAGRGTIAVHDRAALPQDVAAGNLVTISNQNGTLAVTDPQQQERGLGRVS